MSSGWLSEPNVSSHLADAVGGEKHRTIKGFQVAPERAGRWSRNLGGPKSLNRSCVVACIGQCVAAGVPQYVDVNPEREAVEFAQVIE